ncbi:MAG TPA: MerR family transcriptional regulator [Pilimelia sp.]|nr:MerR family transcriptional regulator [Pilimelia sp.]
MRIGELSRRTGVSERLLRYYEQQRLLLPARSANGYRSYSERDVATVRRIRTLLTAGLSTSTIVNVLPCVTENGEFLTPTCSRTRAELEDERRRISAAIEDLQVTRTILESVLGAAPVGAGPMR